MRLLVIGGGGFIGRHFVRAATERGHSVSVAGRKDVAPSGFQLSRYISGGLAAVSEDIDALGSAEIICHFATTTTPASSAGDPVADLETNLRDTVRLLEAMRLVGSKRILYLSSGGALYGDPKYLPIDEGHPLFPTSAYGVTKVAVENYLRMYELNHGFRSTIVRPSNPYGANQANSIQVGAVTRFIQCAMRGEPVTIWGDGSVIRDYIHISDVVDLLIRAAESDTTGTYNCGTGVGTSLNQLIELVEAGTGKQLSISKASPRPFDPPTVVLNSSLASRAFGWRPQVSLAEGIAETARLYS